MEKNREECLKRDNWVVLSKFMSVMEAPNTYGNAKEEAEKETIAFAIGSNMLTDFSNLSILTELLSYDINLFKNEHLSKVIEECLAKEENQGTPEFYHLSGLVGFAKNKDALKKFGSDLRFIRMVGTRQNPIVAEIVGNFSKAMEGYNKRASNNFETNRLKAFCDKEKAFEINSMMWLEETVAIGASIYNVKDNSAPFKMLIHGLRNADKNKSAEKDYCLAKAAKVVYELEAKSPKERFEADDKICGQMRENYNDHIEESRIDGYMSEARYLGLDMMKEASSSPCN